MSILVTGATGQIGSELLIALRRQFGKSVVGTSRRNKPPPIVDTLYPGPFHSNIDIRNKEEIATLLDRYPKLHTIYHLAALLSGDGEKNPQQCWRVNIDGTLNILDAARIRGINKILIPSSSAAFGPNSPSDAPQETVMNPTTIYGVTKLTGELLGNYYNLKYGMDIRGLRIPGIIGSEFVPIGTTSGYATNMFYGALSKGYYACYIAADTALPMLYMPDCIHAMISLMQADRKRLIHRCDCNVSAYSFTPRQLSDCIRKYIPNFTIEYKADFRQSIAESWPDSIIDDAARNEWDWKPQFSLNDMTKDMIKRLSDRYKQTTTYYPASTTQSKL